MSAIGGIVSLTGNNISKASLENMCLVMKNRGSDTQNIWNDNEVGMVHRQLWTTLESQHENQPLVATSQDLILTADARIDNRDELLPLLNNFFNNYSIITDADIILASYQEWQEHCVNYLIGDFSFAIWDTAAKKIFCARDHLGIKPFNYLHTKEGFYFSSEIKALFIASGQDKELNIANAQRHIEHYNIAPDATFLKQVKRLIPGHTLTLQGDKITIQRYWFPESIAINKSITLEEATTKFHTLINEATRVRLRSVYGIGCEISGGLDSSTILSLALKHTDVIPFASTYESYPCDESEYIKAICKKLNVSPIITEGDKLDYKNTDNLTNFYGIASDWPGKCAFLECVDEFRKAEQHSVRVMLTGQGGDHVASGHPRRLTDYLRSGAIMRLYQEYKTYPFNKSTIISYFIAPFLPIWIKRRVKILLKKPDSASVSIPKPIFWSPKNELVQASHAQTGTLNWICGDNNIFWMDFNPYSTVGGHFDIESRHPFFDKRVVEFMLSLPQWLKNDGIQDKIVLREAMKHYFPESISKRNDKAEFTPIIKLQLQELLINNKHLSVIFNSKNDTIMKFIPYDNKSDVDEVWKQMCLSEWIRHNNLGVNNETKEQTDSF